MGIVGDGQRSLELFAAADLGIFGKKGFGDVFVAVEVVFAVAVVVDGYT